MRAGGLSPMGAALGCLGFGLAVLFVPPLNGAAQAPRWAMIATLGVLVACLARPRVPRETAAAGLALLLWIGLGMLWAPVGVDGVAGMAAAGAFAVAFLIGAGAVDIRPLWLGVGVGLAVNAILALAQHPSLLAWDGIPQAAAPAGLFGNRNSLAAVAALALVAAVACRQRWLLPAPILLLALTSSRAALLAAAAGSCAIVWQRSRPGALALAAAGVAVALAVSATPSSPGPQNGRIYSTEERARVLLDTWDGLTVLGRGTGSFYATFPAVAIRQDTLLQGRPLHAHSDVLELIYENGIPGLVLAALLLGLVLRDAGEPERAVLAAGLVLVAIDYPLHLPATAFLLGAVAGHGARFGRRVREPVHVG